jgi:hypothetical protein
MRRLLSAGLVLLPAILVAQAPPAVRPAAEQIAGAVIPLPAEMRAGATVLGYDAKGAMVPLKQGTGEMICLADNPADTLFHAACYHKSMEPFMARGRSLRAEGIRGPQVDTVRFREVREGKLAMPTKPAALWQITGPHSAIDITNQSHAASIRPLYVVYMPGATTESTGIPAKPAAGVPWLMFPGTPKAHIMFTPSM